MHSMFVISILLASALNFATSFRNMDPPREDWKIELDIKGYTRRELKVIVYPDSVVISGKKVSHNYHGRALFPIDPVNIPAPSDVDLDKAVAYFSKNSRNSRKLTVKAPYKSRRGREIYIRPDCFEDKDN